MLTSSFCHVPGIGPKLERRLWSLGFHTWQSFLDRDEQALSPGRTARLDRCLNESLRHLDEENATYFVTNLPNEEHWRLFREFRHSVAYFDIESTGSRGGIDHITTIALYDGGGIRTYVFDRNLDEFPRDIQRYKLIVTYNGKCFDVPFVEQYFGIEIRAAHIDLRFVLNGLGFKGGLKGCEKIIGIDRGALDGVDGYFAVLLWNEFARTGDERALETLLAYNIQDVVNLESLMVHAYNRKLRPLPFAESLTTIPPPRPLSPFAPHAEIIHRIRSRYFAYRRAGRRAD